MPRVDQLEDKTDNDRARIIKSEKAEGGIAAEFKKEISRADVKVGSFVRVRIDESLQEENEKNAKRNSVILFAVAESEAVEAMIGFRMTWEKWRNC